MQTIVGKKFPEVLIPLIEAARNSIDIVVFDWRWYPNDPGASAQLFNQAIARAVKRGVKIRAIVNSPDIENTLKSIGVFARRLLIKNLVHCKLMIIDERTTVVGSHNYTQSAFTMNMELSVVFEAEKNDNSFVDFFNNLYIL
jgi:phosphatidylserine/phosphatidylglycerophosphate/cardiolipin synthase-like enzyme